MPTAYCLLINKCLKGAKVPEIGIIPESTTPIDKYMFVEFLDFIISTLVHFKL